MNYNIRMYNINRYIELYIYIYITAYINRYFKLCILPLID